MHARSPRSHPRRSWSLALPTASALALVSSLVGSFSGCGFSTHGLGTSGTGGSSATCSNDAQCDDDNPCTIDACDQAEGLCKNTAVKDGDPSPDQDPGDCHTVLCQGGEPVDQIDDADVPDDGEDCTDDLCTSGTPSNTDKPDLTVCKTKDGLDGSCHGGACVVGCSDTQPCPDMGPCQTAVCDVSTSTCTYSNVDDGTPTPGVDQTSGDCHRRICVGGQDVDQVDDGDVPAPPNDCTVVTCDNGAVTPTPLPLNKACNTYNGASPGFCDGAGTCAECGDDDTQCFGTSPTNDCEKPGCVNHDCKPVYAAAGTAVGNTPPAGCNLQAAGDCHEVRCNGNGGCTNAVDDTDLPDDSNDCTNDLCSGGVASHTNVVPGSACGSVQCGAPLVCNDMGQCAGCTADCQCQPPAYNTCGGGNPGVANVCGCTPKSCAQQNFTCGAVTNGCGQPFNCDSGTKNGGETDVDCGGPTSTCPTRCGQGMKCGATSDCQNGLTCVDGVCCNTPCGGACQACTAAKKGGGQDGVCGNVAVNTDPDNECATQSASTCGTTGVCNGSGACQLYTSGTVCNNAMCVGNVLNFTDTCNGGGTCSDGGSQDCSPYACKAGPSCPTSCAGDADCASGNYCNASNQCVAKLSNGLSCMTANQCTSGNCVDGVCCNSSCTGVCQACTTAKKGGGNNGFCGNIASGQDPDNECATQAASTCGTTGVCGGNGTCQLYASGAQCAAQVCSAGVQTSVRTCNGTGTCQNGTTTSCGTYVCNAGGTACLTSCTSNADCAAGNFCNAMSQCVGLTPDGQTCGGDGECQNGHCVDSVCCNTTCTGLCQACTAAKKGGGSDGQCGNVASGQDPDNECAASAQSTCGQDGACNGAGACRLWANGTQCAAQTCNAGVETSARTCNGTGTCQNPTTKNCTPYVCNAGGTACLTTCSGDSDCVANHYCNGGTCSPQKTQGSSCSSSGMTSECSTGFCTDGVCCDNLCSGECQACTAAKKGSGSDGTCGNVAANTDPDSECAAQDASTCGTTGVCDGGGACQLWASGTTCAAATCTNDANSSSVTSAETCDGAGTCPMPTTTSCGNYRCNAGGTACLTGCSSSADCIPGTSCNGGSKCM